jgi:hypothetical protein
MDSHFEHAGLNLKCRLDGQRILVQYWCRQLEPVHNPTRMHCPNLNNTNFAEVGTNMPAWTKEHDDHLREMAAKGASATRIAASLNKKMQNVRARARVLGCALPTISQQRRMLKPVE